MTVKKYKPAKYSVEIELAKSPDDVFDHLIDLSKWWPEEFEGESIELNSEFIFRTGDSHYSKNKVVEFVPDKKLVWLVTESIRKMLAVRALFYEFLIYILSGEFVKVNILWSWISLSISIDFLKPNFVKNLIEFRLRICVNASIFCSRMV